MTRVSGSIGDVLQQVIAALVDPKCIGGRGAGNIDCRIDILARHKAMHSRIEPATTIYDAWSALANSASSALFKSDTAQNDIPLWNQ